MTPTCTARLSLSTAWIAMAALAACGTAPVVDDPDGEAGARWVSSWISAQQVPEPHNALPEFALVDTTLRQLIRPTLSGERIRIRLSNAFGTRPLSLHAASVARAARADTSAIDAGSSRRLTFSGRDAVVIPAGAYVFSDEAAFDVVAGEHLAVSLYYETAPVPQTGHPGSRATSYWLPGNHAASPEFVGAETATHWYQVAELQVRARARARAVVVFGDSITDGYGVQPDTDSRWPDFLAERVAADPELQCSLAVLNAGLGGNRLLLDGLGPNGVARFDRDVLARAGVDYVIVSLGVNDLGMFRREPPTDGTTIEEHTVQMLAGYRELVRRAREKGIRVIGATISPFLGFGYYEPGADNEAERQRINTWLRTPGNVDDLLDFDAVLRDPADASRLDPAIDSGDHLHPSIAGYRRMAQAVPLEWFRKAPGGGADCR